MQKYYPYIFPVAAVLILMFLSARWYNMRTQKDGKEALMPSEGVVIENLSQEELQKIVRGVGDYKSAELKGEGDVMGNVRYEVADGKVKFSVTADVPRLQNVSYAVWVKENGSDSLRKAFDLEEGKAGFVGSAAMSDSVLPLEVVVAQVKSGSGEMGEVLLKGSLAR